MKYRKNPVVIDAIQFKDDPDTLIEIQEFMGGGELRISYENPDNPVIKIETLEGVMEASVGDFIIRGVKGEYYPCKPDIFEQTYKKETGRTEKIRIESDGQTATVYLDGEPIRGTLVDFSFHGDVENGVHIKWDGTMQRLDENGRAYVENDEVVTEEFHYDSKQVAAHE